MTDGAIFKMYAVTMGKKYLDVLKHPTIPYFISNRSVTA